MAFDFIGTTPDESGEDSGTIQVKPTITAFREKEELSQCPLHIYSTALLSLKDTHILEKFD